MSWFSSQNVSNLKLKADKESHIVINQPWITNMDGYTSVLKGVITSPRFTTSLPYSQAANGHSLQVCVYLKDMLKEVNALH